MTGKPSEEAPERIVEATLKEQSDSESSAKFAGAEHSSLWLEILAVLIWTVLADLLIYRWFGFSSLAVFASAATGLIVVLRAVQYSNLTDSKRNIALSVSSWVLLVLAISIGRLVWQGSIGTVVSVLLLLPALAISTAGQMPNVLPGLQFVFGSPLFGAGRAWDYLTGWSISKRAVGAQAWLPIVAPIVAVIAFGTIFIFANPDLLNFTSRWMSDLVEAVNTFFNRISVPEFLFCMTAFFVAAGFLMPLVSDRWLAPPTSAAEVSRNKFGEPDAAKLYPSSLYPAFRNTLITLIVLFLIYLPYEAITLWGRSFPEGFYYAGYAHQGAAWLTFALAMATGVLSLIFNRMTLTSDSIAKLRPMAWTWSFLNLLLAVAVYNRLFIYIGYNGMTPMRTVGLFGITLVVVGFAFVIIKIARQRSFLWLVRSYLIAFVATLIAYSIFPVDYVVHRYNASRINAGYLKPSVMIAVKEIDDEGILPLLKLVDCPDPIIREGVLAILAELAISIEKYSSDTPWHWSRYQRSKSVLYQRLKRVEPAWQKYHGDQIARRAAMNEFKQYAMKWY